MKSSLPLRALQRWFAHVVQHPQTAATALRAAPARRIVAPNAIAAVLAANPRMSAAAMLDVYNGGYLARLIEVMVSDYGALQHAMGEHAFHELAARYLHRHPSRHPNLNQLGKQFPAFIASSRALPRRAFLSDLAQLELAVSTAFDAPEFVPLAADALAAVPPEQWDRITFQTNPSLQLLALRHQVDHFYQPWKEGSPIAAAPFASRPQRSWLAVFRRDDRVWRQRLDRGQYRVLHAVAAGQPLAEALALAPAGAPLGEWFAGFARDGLFVGLRRRPRSTRRKRTAR